MVRIAFFLMKGLEDDMRVIRSELRSLARSWFTKHPNPAECTVSVLKDTQII